MKVLITGANGFLGRHVVSAFVRRGHAVRALVRSIANVSALSQHRQVEYIVADLLGPEDLDVAFEGIDALVHLAACVNGDDDARFASTVVGTERLLEAMSRSRTRILVLAGSFCVYDYRGVNKRIDEQSALEANVYQRDGYAVAKIWQQRVAHRYSKAHGWDLRVLRPGFIWGHGGGWPAGCGVRLGGLCVVVAPLARPPLTHVENCADCFVTVTQSRHAAGRTFNVADEPGVSTWRWVRDYHRGTGSRVRTIYVPYWLGMATARLASAVSRILFGPGGKLPSILMPYRFRARFKPLRCSSVNLYRQLGWYAPLSYERCLTRTYDQPINETLSSPEAVEEAAHG